MRNWTINEAVAVINANQDQAAIAEIAKHFPTFFMVVAKNDLAGLTSMMGEKFTVRRLNLNGAVIEGTEDGEVEATEATTEAGGEDLESMSTKQLMQLCDKRGIKVPHYGKNKAFYLEALQGTPETAEAEDDTEDEETDPYAGKNAMQLFKMCKERGIKAQPKKKTADYIKLLKAADASGAEADGEEDGWGDEEEEAPAPKKKAPAKQAPKAKAAKAKKVEPEEDEDDTSDDGDDWDI